MGKITVLKDGQPVVLPWDEATGAQLKQQLSIAPNRIVTIAEEGGTRGVSDNEVVRLQEGVYISDAPRFTYGGPKRVEVVISQDDYDALRKHLWSSTPLEQHAFLLCGACTSDRGLRLLVRDMVFAKSGDFLTQTPGYIELSPSYYLPVLDRCRAEGLHIIEVHSHPFADKHVTFSDIDIQNELEKFEWYSERLPSTHALALVLGRESVDGNWWDPEADLIRPISALRVVGPTVKVIAATSAPNVETRAQLWPDTFHRQELAFGRAGQEMISRTRVAIVGCGGLGSAMAQQLAYLGVRDFVLVDHDKVEQTNLNRLVGALPQDAREERLKVDVLKRTILGVCPEARVVTVPLPISDRTAQQAVKDVDVLIGGVDSDGARIVINEISVRHLIPYIDLGTGINVEDGRVVEAGGQLWLVRPGDFCLLCTGVINAYEARVDLMDEVERNRHIARGYGTDDPQPAVIFLNSVLASLAVGEFVKMVTGFRPPESMVFYDALKPSAQPFRPPARDPNCPICRRDALYGLGDEPDDTAYRREVPVAELISTSGEPTGEPGREE